MPVPVLSALQANEEQAVENALAVRRRMPQFVVSAMLAGAFIGVAVVLLISVSAPMVAAGSSGARLTEGAVFGVALALVVFAGGELFTGVVMVMLQGLLRRTVRLTEVVAVCAAAWVGNLVGSVAFAKLVDLSGVLSAGAPKGRTTAQLGLLAGMIQSKSGLTASQLFFRGVLCNALLCLGLWMASRATSDAAKLICLWWSLLAFIGSGFEHCVANMTLFALAIFNHVPGATDAEMGRNLLLTTLGNIVGGLLIGLAYSCLAPWNREAALPDGDVYPTEVVDRVEPPVPAQQTPAKRRAATTTATPTATSVKAPRRTRTTTAPARR